MNKVRKVLIIVFLALSIASLVFTLMKKTGLCAGENESTTGVYNFPLPYGGSSGYGYKNFPYTDSIGVGAVQFLVNNYSFDTSKGWAIFVYEVASDNSYIDMIVARPTLSSDVPQPFITGVTNQTFNTSDCKVKLHFQNRHKVRYTSASGTYERTSYTSSATTEYIILNKYIESDAGLNLYLPKDTYVLFYPLLFSNTESEYYGEFEVFTFGATTPEHNKGGILVEITENDEIAEEELTGVDTTTPSDPTNNSAWYQKILNAIGRVNTSIQGGIITTTDYLQQLLSGQRNFQLDLLATLGVISGKLDGISQGTPEEIASDWVEGYEDSSLYDIKTTFEHTKGGVQAMFTPSSKALILGNWSLYRSGEHLYLEGLYTLPAVFGGNQQHITLNFDWYNSIKSWFVPLIVSLMTIGLTVTIFKGMPSMIQGAGTTFKTINDKESK